MLRSIQTVHAFLALAAALAVVLPPVTARSQAPDPFEEQRERDRDRELDEARAGTDGQTSGSTQDAYLKLTREQRRRLEESGLRGTTLPDEDTALARGQDIPADTPGSAAKQIPAPAENREQDGTVLEPDPYEPIGIRMGSFLLFPELGMETVYNGNVFLTGSSPESDWALAMTPGLKARSDWSRHSLELNLGAEHSYHDRFESENDKSYDAGVTGRLDILSTTNLVAAAAYSQSLEDRSSNDFPDNAAERAKIKTHAYSLEGNHTLNRVTLTLRGDISSEDYADAALNDGTIANNDDRDFTERRVTGRASYEFQPGVAAFVEASGNQRDFAEAVDDDGTRNGSAGNDVQAGLSFRLSGKLTGEASAGYAIQRPDDVSLDDIDGLIFNAGLEWKATGLTTVRFDASSKVAETTQIGSAGSIVRAAELSVKHRPRRHIVLGAALRYERETFAGSEQADEEWVAGLTGEYLFTPSLALTLGYDHLKSTSSSPGSDYTADEVRFGVRVRR